MYITIALILGVVAGIAFDRFLLFLIVGLLLGLSAQLLCAERKKKRRKN